MGSWPTRANALSLLRLLAAPALFVAIQAGRPSLAMIVFFLAIGTDFADGWVARRYGEVTPLGGLIDHAADATFVCVGTAALAYSGVLPVLLPILIAAAFLQYVFDSRGLAASRLRPSSLGRWNGIAYYVIVGVPIVRDTLGLVWPGAGLVTVLGWVLVGATLASIADRLRWTLLSRRARGSPV